MRASRVPAGAAPFLALALALSACGGTNEPAATPPTTPVSTSAVPIPTPTPSASPAAARLPVPTIERTLASGLSVPWGLAVLPDGSTLVGERDSAQVIRISSSGAKSVVGTVAGVEPRGEGGLLGLTLSPTFSKDRLVYAYATTASGNKVVRLRWPSGGRLSAPTTILSGIPSGTIHNGGRLAFGPDGLLYVTTGDGGVTSRAQDRSSLGGKILRIRADGSIPSDNPFSGSPVWSYGHRNVQGIAWDSQKRLWASEFGQKTYDELNLITRGGNYGWPIVEGPSEDSRFVAPFTTWRPTDTASPSGLAIVDDIAYLGALRGERLWQVPLTGADRSKATSRLQGALGRIRSVVALDGTHLLVTTSNTDGRGQPRNGDDKVVLVRLK